MLDELYDEFEERVPGFKSYKRNLTILISSPNVSVKYHSDVPGQSLWQVRGTKKLYVYPNTQPFIFDLFTQGYRSLERAQGGLGIGLSLVRTLTQLHGGTVDVVSAGVGLGSQFILKLPLSPLPMPGAILVPAPPATALPRRILLIEDNADAAELLALLLEQDGHQVDVRLDGPSGLRAVLDAPYDVVICDIGLPGMDGYQVIGSARAALTAPFPCFIAASGYSQLGQFDLAGAAGFDHYLVKPINIEALSDIITAQVPRRVDGRPGSGV